MQELINAVTQLYKTWCGSEPTSVDVIQQSGSDRRYFRLHGNECRTVIGTHGLNVPENEAFIYFSGQFHKKELHVPEIIAVSEDETVYLQEDFGDTSLMNILEEKGCVPEVYELFKESLYQLVRLQVKGDEGLNYEKCLTNKEFGKQAIMADLLYFKYYFLDALHKPYDKQRLIDDFEALSNYLTHTEYKYFMFRDFQSRNIMVTEDKQVHFIDYQGGMKGAPQYDVASMLWQARANLPDEWKTALLEEYMDSFENVISTTIDRDVFRSQYNGYVLIRLLQVLGAYGFRGLFERKAHFLTSIPQALKNLKWFVDNNNMGIAVPEFQKVLQLCIDNEIMARFTPVQADANTPLHVKICSFSYRKGIPEDKSVHGGGFVFDCRGIDNPGRHVEYKEIHGRDRPVMEYLERQTRMNDFLNSVFDIVDISVEEYIKRGFDHLTINFGCTGGQHRSVYAADATARHLRNKYKVKIELCHREQEAKGWKNPLGSSYPALKKEDE
ncbi:RapZ C-terminal domain-containing protein [Flavisolibacter ginsenosidimutans]|uniref:Phosphotransferase n=1 Tax=Flavisolibacter ginsenosidimutans TaxID=661481 RepID=A0A5B8UNM3_9BACT|nr:RNase adapter RapZ [Flavisolibacter ginsenosidimutans]QEC57819.1 phosphotransferase [Flavisolibacter ginsenosidimutans]